MKRRPSRSALTILVLIGMEFLPLSVEASFFQRVLSSPRSCLLEVFNKVSNGESPSDLPSAKSKVAVTDLKSLPASVPQAPLVDRDYDFASRLWEEDLSLQKGGLSDPSQRSRFQVARDEARQKLYRISQGAPSGTLEATRTLALQFESVLRYAPAQRRESLFLIRDSMLHSAHPEARRTLSAYLQSVWDEAHLVDLHSTSRPSLSSDEILEQVLRRRIKAQGFPEPRILDRLLTPEEFIRFIQVSPSFIDEVDIAVESLKAMGKVNSNQPTHGRLTHLATLDYLGFCFRKKGRPPTELRETLEWALSRDPITAKAVWGYLFDQAPKGEGGVGLSSPDVFHEVLQEAWGLSK